MKSIVLKMTFFFCAISVYAHDGGHGQSELWLIDNKPVVAEFLKYQEGKIFLLDKHSEVLSYNLSQLSPKHQALILKRQKSIVRVNEAINHTKGVSFWKTTFPYAIGLGALLVLVSLLLFIKKNKRLHLAYGIAGLCLVIITACGKNDEATPNQSTVPANDVSFLTSLFGKFSNVSTESDSEWFYIAGNGLPEHNMMVGITNWQQQVAINQDFTGSNRWQIPIQPVVASTPQPMANEFFRNAIAISVNGVPLYHPMTNAGVDAFASGQLDQWGGHCGRADDYHYHLPPTHLESTIGSNMPVAYALDGFPIYGQTTETLDENLGRYNSEGGYQYHTTTTYPYFMANLVGQVNLTQTQDGQNTVYEIIPQPTTQGARPSTDPLSGNLEITNFSSTGTNAYELTYRLNNETYRINYSWNASNVYTYIFTKPDGTSTTETYQR
ncbi:hypothetical protein BKI52_06545 [marine bacterium AO1-C]|nr:hypothetical protein BKI52_06545 [marine bacterium AO1-C]